MLVYTSGCIIILFLGIIILSLKLVQVEYFKLIKQFIKIMKFACIAALTAYTQATKTFELEDFLNE